MKIRRISAFVCAAGFAAMSVIYACAAADLTRTDSVNKFDLGSDETGGSGVELDEGSETTGKNWIKIVQNSNDLKLFEDVGTSDEIGNVTALAVTFEISGWTGTDFPVTWGANIDFTGDSATTWCGTGAFEGISDYTISGDGEYTLVCDLAALASAQGKEGIAHLQTCEMVICDVEEGDSTVIEVKSARIYADGETPEEAVIPEAASASTSSEDSSEDDSSDSDDTSSSSDSSSTGTTSSASTSSSASKSTGTSTSTAAAASASASDSTGESSATGVPAGIALTVSAIAASAIVVSKKK